MLNRSIIELRYKDKVYKDIRDIKKVLQQNDCEWLLECEVENAIISIEKKTVIFESGVFLNGDFEYGIFKGEFRGGAFINGIFEGNFTGGEFVSGIKK